MPKKSTVPNASVFVKNLPYDAKEVDLKDVFAKFGRLRDVYIPLDFHTKEPRGFGYIQFENTQDADAAVQELKGFKMRGRELDVRFAEGDRKKPGQMVRKENNMRRNVSPIRGRAESPGSRRRRSSPQPHRSMNRRNSPPPYHSPPRNRGHSPLLRQRQRSPAIHHRSPPQNRSHSRQESPVRNRLSLGLAPRSRSPPSRRRVPMRRSSPIRGRSPLGKEHVVRRQRSPLRRRMSHSPPRRVRSPAPLIDSPPRVSDHTLRRSPRNRSPVHRSSRRSPSPGIRPNLNRNKHSMREELIVSSRRSLSPPRVRHHTSPLTNHRITVSNDSGNKDDRMIGSARQSGRIRARENRIDDRNLEDSRVSKYDDEDQGASRIRRSQGSFDHSPPRKRPIRRSPVRLNHSAVPRDRSRFSPDFSKGRGRTRVRGRSPRGEREGIRGRSPEARVLLETPEIPPQQERSHSSRTHKISDRRRDDHAFRSRRRQSDSRRNNDEEYEFVDEEEYYEELDAMDDMDNLDINFN